MKNGRRILFAITVLAVAALACALPGGLGGGNSNVILSDDFSSQSWGTATDQDSSVAYANDALQFLVFRTNYFVWSTPNDEDYSNIHVEVTALNNSTDTTTAFGVICHMQVTDVSYYFAATPAGQYAIGKSQLAGDDIFLTNNDQWANSDQIPVNQSSYRVGADCASNGTLTFYVNGTQIASAVDTSYTAGNVALFVWSGEQESGANISFDDFQVSALP